MNPKSIISTRILGLLLFALSLSACKQYETVQEITPGFVTVVPFAFATDSTIFEALRDFPEAKILEIEWCSYRKPVSTQIDSSDYFRAFVQEIPFVGFVYNDFFVTSGDTNYFQFSCLLENMDTLNQNRWLFVLDSIGFVTNHNAVSGRKIHLAIPESKELEYATRLKEYPFVRSANPILRPKIILRKRISFKV